jgi:hypothetical protein
MPGLNSSGAVVRQLIRIPGNATFQRAAPLRFLVDETVQGRSHRLKEYTLGGEGLDKGHTLMESTYSVRAGSFVATKPTPRFGPSSATQACLRITVCPRTASGRRR